MSYEHKAFIFDIDGFNRELKPLLESCLRSGSIDQMRDFIVSNRQSLVDPYEGFALEDSWEDMIESKDVHQYGISHLRNIIRLLMTEGLAYGGVFLKSCFLIKVN